jgi:hypothetical protein
VIDRERKREKQRGMERQERNREADIVKRNEKIQDENSGECVKKRERERRRGERGRKRGERKREEGRRERERGRDKRERERNR